LFVDARFPVVLQDNAHLAFDAIPVP